MRSDSLSAPAAHALGVAREAARLALDALPVARAAKDIRYKSPTDLVTRTDHDVERLIVERLRERFPDYAVLGEEGGLLDAAAGADPARPRWIVDPIDGTSNFAIGLPWFGISIALEERGRVACGVVAMPPLDEFFVADRGRGAFRAGGDGTLHPLRPSQTRDLGGAMVATGLPREPLRSRHVTTIPPIMLRCLEVRIMGAAAVHLAYVAAGRLDAFWEPGLSPWDVAAGILLVEEAGGRVTDWAGRPLPGLGGALLATNGLVHEPLLALLKDAAPALEVGPGGGGGG